MSSGPNGEFEAYGVPPDVGERLAAVEAAVKYDYRIAALESTREHLATREEVRTSEITTADRIEERFKWAVRQLWIIAGVLVGVLSLLLAVWELFLKPD